MKVFILSLFTSLSFAMEYPRSVIQESTLRYTYFKPCDFWTNMRGDNGMSGYVCSNYPFDQKLVDFDSLYQVLLDQDQRLQSLEAKLKDIEAKLPK